MVFGTGSALWVPGEPLDPIPNAAPPREVEAPGGGDVLAGLDGSRRPVLVRSAFSAAGEGPAAVLAHPSEDVDDEEGEVTIDAQLLTWHDARVEIVGFHTRDSGMSRGSTSTTPGGR